MSTDKHQKLQRYERKDYDETVNFPVEIVGRDGLVREYAFEDAIRLYQRRVTFAPIRYRDRELRDAETRHCRSRIDQLRRSYFVRFGWGTPEGKPDGQALFGVLAGELTAFFQRIFQHEGRAEVLVEPLQEQDGVTSWYVTPKGRKAGLILYVHRFSVDAPEQLRETFFSRLKVLEQDGVAESSEKLVAFHHTNDCGFIMTARDGEFSSLANEQGVESGAAPERSDWDIVVDMVRRGQYEQGLVLCNEMVRAQPWDRKAYMMGAMLASYLGYELTSEEMSVLGSMYFKDQAELHYWTGLARRRQGRTGECLLSFQEAITIEPGLVAARYYLATSLIDLGRYGEANDILRAGDLERSDDRRGHLLLGRMAQWLRWRRWMVAGGVFSQVLGVAIALLGGWIGLVPVAMGIAITWGGMRTFSLQIERVNDLQRFDDVGYWLRRISRQGQRADRLT